MLRHFRMPIVFALVCFALGAWYGWAQSGTLAGMGEVLWIVAVLSVLEISLSFDNAVVNATVLQDMDPIWQKRFLTWGMVFAVYGMYVIFPLAIVAVAAGLGPIETVRLSLADPVAYERIVSSAHTAIAGFGGAFLGMVGLKFFFDEEKDVHWVASVERLLARASALPAVETLVVAVALVLLVQYLIPGRLILPRKRLADRVSQSRYKLISTGCSNGSSPCKACRSGLTRNFVLVRQGQFSILSPRLAVGADEAAGLAVVVAAPCSGIS